MERDRLMGEYDPNTNYTSKWVHFAAMSFICDSKRPRYTVDYDNANSNDHHLYDQEIMYDPEQQYHSDIYEDVKHSPTHITHEGAKYEFHSMQHNGEGVEEDDDEAANDMLFKEFQNLATPQAARRLSATISMAKSLKHNTQHSMPLNYQQHTDTEPPDDNFKRTAANTKSEDCNCSKRTDDQVHFLEDLEKEEQKLIISTRKDITRSNKLDHVGDSDYNFLVSFLPQMKKMSELENLQFRAKMCDMVLNILAPSISTNPSPVPTSSIPYVSRNATPTITYQPPESSVENYQETENENNTATSTSSNYY